MDARALAMLLAATLTLPLAVVAEEAEDGSTTATSTSTSAPDADAGEDADAGNDTSGRRGQGKGNATDDCSRRPARCTTDEPGIGNTTEEGQGTEQAAEEPPAPAEPRSGRFIRYDLSGDRAAVLDVRLGNLLALREARLAGAAPVEARDHGEVLRIRTEDARLELHDQSGALLRFQSDDANVTLLLTIPPDATVQSEDKGAVATYADGRRAVLRYDNGTWTGNELVASGFASFHVAQPESRRGDDGHKADVQEAVEQRKVAAEVQITPGQDSTVVAYDDVTVQIELPQTEGAPVRVELDSNLTEGRTVVLSIDRALLASTDPERLELRYFDVHGDGNETEVVFRPATDLADILDPSDDGGQPEYYVVSDAQGLQVMVSVPHWSVHAVTMSSLAELAQPRVVVGLVVGFAGVGLAAVALFWPRRE